MGTGWRLYLVVDWSLVTSKSEGYFTLDPSAEIVVVVVEVVVGVVVG